MILSESASEIVLDVLLKGGKGETLGVAKTSIPADQISRVERMPEATRSRMRGRADAFADRTKLLADALSKIRFVEVKFGPLNAVQTETEAFTLLATCDDQTAKETAHALTQMFDAFRRHFAVRRTPARKIAVVFLASRRQYDQVQLETAGRVLLNPASFNLTENRILAFNSVQSIEAANVRQAIAAAELEVEEAKKEVAAAEADLARQVREFQAQLNEEAAKLRKRFAGDPQADAIITREKQKVQESLKRQEQAIRDDLTTKRRRLNELVERNRGVNLQNRRILALQSRAMYETLFHEAFHAFAANFLWADTDNAALPRWLHEGMATYFERSVIEAGELVHGGVHPEFLDLIRKTPMLIEEVLRAGPEVYRVSHDGEAARSNAQYAAAWSLAHFLVTRGTTKEQWEAYARASVAGDSRKAFEALGGKPLAQLDTDWRLHLGRLK